MIRNLHEDARAVAAACLLLAALLVPGVPGFSDDRTLHMLLIGEVYPQ